MHIESLEDSVLLKCEGSKGISRYSVGVQIKGPPSFKILICCAPFLVVNLSGHSSFLVYHQYNWLILCAIAIISGVARHYFNLRGRNIHKLYILISSIIALIVLAVLVLLFK